MRQLCLGDLLVLDHVVGEYLLELCPVVEERVLLGGAEFVERVIVGTKTVLSLRPFRVLARSVFLMASASMDRFGLLSTAVVMFSCAICAALPLPLCGSLEQPGPKGCSLGDGDGDAVSVALGEEPEADAWDASTPSDTGRLSAAATVTATVRTRTDFIPIPRSLWRRAWAWIGSTDLLREPPDEGSARRLGNHTTPAGSSFLVEPSTI